MSFRYPTIAAPDFALPIAFVLLIYPKKVPLFALTMFTYESNVNPTKRV